MKTVLSILLVVVCLFGFTAVAHADAYILPQATSCYNTGTNTFTMFMLNAGNAPGNIGYTLSQDVLGHYLQSGSVVDLGYFAVNELKYVDVPQGYWGTYLFLVVSFQPGIWFWNGQTHLVTLQYGNNGAVLNACVPMNGFDQPPPVESGVQPAAMNGAPVAGMVTFTHFTPLFWKADELAWVGLYVLEGQTAQYLQTQEEFTQILWAGSLLWVWTEDILVE